MLCVGRKKKKGTIGRGSARQVQRKVFRAPGDEPDCPLGFNRQTDEEGELVGGISTQSKLFHLSQRLKRNGTVECRLVTWPCKMCQMPLSKQSADHIEVCNGIHASNAAFPKNNKRMFTPEEAPDSLEHLKWQLK
jgi:hypothetical protein